MVSEKPYYCSICGEIRYSSALPDRPGCQEDHGDHVWKEAKNEMSPE